LSARCLTGINTVAASLQEHSASTIGKSFATAATEEHGNIKTEIIKESLIKPSFRAERSGDPESISW
jgi:hypothetical protein